MVQTSLNKLPNFGFFTKRGLAAFVRARKLLALGLYSSYYSVLVVRGIGYRIMYNKNELEDIIFQAQNLWRNVIPENWETIWFSKKKSELDVLLSEPIEKIGQILHFSRYLRTLILDLGHAYDSMIPIATDVALRQYRKNRKLIFYSSNSEYLKTWTRSIFNHRIPSVFTGRGVRLKKEMPFRKRRKSKMPVGTLGSRRRVW